MCNLFYYNGTTLLPQFFRQWIGQSPSPYVWVNMVSHDSHWMYNNSVPLYYGQDVWMYVGCSWSCVLSFKYSDFVISTSKVNRAQVASMTVLWRYKEVDLSCSQVQRSLVSGSVGTLTLSLCSHHWQPETSCRHLSHLMLLVDCRWSQLSCAVYFF